MADVKWIRISTNIFENRKIKMIESLPNGDSIIVIWIKLLSLAGTVNNQGYVYFTKNLPYTTQMLATEFNRPITTVELAINTFKEFGMIEVEDELIRISNWEKYQNTDGLEKIREQNRIRQQRHRDQLKLECHVTDNVTHNVTDNVTHNVTDNVTHNVTCNVTDNVTHNVTVTHCHATDIDKDKDKELDKELINKKIDMMDRIDENYPIDPSPELFNSIMDEWNTLSVLGIHPVRIIGPSTERAANLLAQLRKFGRESFTACIANIKKSNYLLGNDGRGPIEFNWLIDGDNYAKVYEGQYTNYKKPAPVKLAGRVRNFAAMDNNEDFEELERQLLDN